MPVRVIVITPPAPVVTWDDARAHLKLDSDDDEQPLVEGMIAAATASIDGPTGWLGRSIGPQTLEARFDGAWPTWAPGGTLTLPYGPIVAVRSVTYLDTSGAPQVADASGYALYGSDLEAAFGTSWPTARAVREAVRVRYDAGYVADPAATPLVGALPPAIRAAILLMVGDLYENRTTVDAGMRAAAVAIPMSATVETLLAPFQVFA